MQRVQSLLPKGCLFGPTTIVANIASENSELILFVSLFFDWLPLNSRTVTLHQGNYSKHWNSQDFLNRLLGINILKQTGSTQDSNVSFDNTNRDLKIWGRKFHLKVFLCEKFSKFSILKNGSIFYLDKFQKTGFFCQLLLRFLFHSPNYKVYWPIFGEW